MTTPRFTITRPDHTGGRFPVWESDSITEAREQLASLYAVIDQSRHPRSGQLESIISDLAEQIRAAES